MAPDPVDDAQRAAEAAAEEARHAADAARLAAAELEQQRSSEGAQGDASRDIGRGGDGIGTGEARG